MLFTSLLWYILHWYEPPSQVTYMPRWLSKCILSHTPDGCLKTLYKLNPSTGQTGERRDRHYLLVTELLLDISRTSWLH